MVESRCPLLSSSLFPIFYGRLLWTTRTRKSFVTGPGLSTDFEITDRQQKLVSSSPLFSIDEKGTRVVARSSSFFFSLSLSLSLLTVEGQDRQGRVFDDDEIGSFGFGFILIRFQLNIILAVLTFSLSTSLRLWETLHKVSSSNDDDGR